MRYITDNLSTATPTLMYRRYIKLYGNILLKMKMKNLVLWLTIRVVLQNQRSSTIPTSETVVITFERFLPLEDPQHL